MDLNVTKGKLFSSLLNCKKNESLGFTLFRLEYWREKAKEHKGPFNIDNKKMFDGHRLYTKWDILDESAKFTYEDRAKVYLAKFKSKELRPNPDISEIHKKEREMMTTFVAYCSM
ncbi:hypothetical protein HDU67_009233 [Dinochytrium kinnereticum]|nr:hypothetical protein HDU67_009233 [Dinochytrium kinnereticum]